eukprot:Em0024g284a
MHKHMQTMVEMMRTSGEMSSEAKPSAGLSVRLVPLGKNDDIEAYQVTFERIMAAHKVKKNRWSQYLAPLSGSTEQSLWGMEKKPETCVAAGELADEYEQARRGPRMKHRVFWTQSILKKSVERRSGPRRKTWGTRERSGAIVVRNGHISSRCPEKEALFCFEDSRFETVSKELGRRSESIPDTTGHGMFQNYEVTVQVQRVTMHVEAAVADDLPVDVLLGTDVPELTRLISDESLRLDSY